MGFVVPCLASSVDFILSINVLFSQVSRRHWNLSYTESTVFSRVSSALDHMMMVCCILWPLDVIEYYCNGVLCSLVSRGHLMLS